tara:strand:- start:35 stop:889 length:855 start_codon:yes stop_codon:yes gene_type:complete
MKKHIKHKNYSLGIDWEDFGLINYDNGKINNYKLYINDFVQETYYLLDLLRKLEITCTFFANARTAEVYPQLLKLIMKDSHEIASHGYKHIARQSLSDEEFYQDCVKSKKIIERIIDKDITGYRSPLLSISRRGYFKSLEILNLAGYTFDSSITAHVYKDLISNSNKISHNKIQVFPLTSLDLKIFSFNIAGGSTWRILPFKLTALILKSLLSTYNTSLYLHPYEFGKRINPHRALSIKGNKIKYILKDLRWNTNKKNIEKILVSLAKDKNVGIYPVSYTKRFN